MATIAPIGFWEWLPIFRWRIVGAVDSADEVPTRLPRNGAVLVGSRSRPKWVAFDCPCRTGHRIMLNADKARSPSWSVAAGRNLTLSPSIDYQGTQRRCHYFIRNGYVMWAPD